MYEHYILDTKNSDTGTKNDGRARDDEYKDPEHYEDPDFEEEWDALEGDQETEDSGALPISTGIEDNIGDSDTIELLPSGDKVDIKTEVWEEV